MRVRFLKSLSEKVSAMHWDAGWEREIKPDEMACDFYLRRIRLIFKSASLPQLPEKTNKPDNRPNCKKERPEGDGAEQE